MSDAIIGGVDGDITDQPAGELGEIITSAGMKYFWNGSKWVSLGPVNEANYGQVFSGGSGSGGEGSTYEFAAPLSESNGTVSVNIGLGYSQVARGDHTHTGYSATSHTHPITSITIEGSNNVAAFLSTNTTQFLRGDGTWAVPPSGGVGGGATTLDGLSNVSISSPSDGQVLKYFGTDSKWKNSTDNTGSGSGGSGTVTSVSVATANGFAGSVIGATTTPAISIKTNGLTGIIKSANDGTISVATAGTDYVVPSGTVQTANGLTTTSGTVIVSAATAPFIGQVLTATSTTAATWQSSASLSGDNTWTGVQTFRNANENEDGVVIEKYENSNKLKLSAGYGTNNFTATISLAGNLTANRTYSLSNESGYISLLSAASTTAGLYIKSGATGYLGSYSDVYKGTIITVPLSSAALSSVNGGIYVFEDGSQITFLLSGVTIAGTNFMLVNSRSADSITLTWNGFHKHLNGSALPGTLPIGKYMSCIYVATNKWIVTGDYT